MLIKDIYLGICDYIKDCYHDNLMRKVLKLGCKMQDKFQTFDSKTNKLSKPIWGEALPWKEGNLIHYIQQRRWSHK